MLKKNLNDLEINGQKGDWCFVNNDTIMFIQWGNSWEDICCVSVDPITGKQTWEFNGNKEFPTLNPSIKVFTKDKTLWHGFLRNGKLEEV